MKHILTFKQKSLIMFDRPSEWQNKLHNVCITKAPSYQWRCQTILTIGLSLNVLTFYLQQTRKKYAFSNNTLPQLPPQILIWPPSLKVVPSQLKITGIWYLQRRLQFKDGNIFNSLVFLLPSLNHSQMLNFPLVFYGFFSICLQTAQVSWLGGIQETNTRLKSSYYLAVCESRHWSQILSADI